MSKAREAAVYLRSVLEDLEIQQITLNVYQDKINEIRKDVTGLLELLDAGIDAEERVMAYLNKMRKEANNEQGI